LAYNLHDFESTDSSLVDVTLPTPADEEPNADGTYTYYIGIDAYSGVRQNINPSSPGDYNLFLYTFATPTFGVYPVSPAPVAGGSTLVGSSGSDTFVGSSGNDYFTFQPGSTGQVSLLAGSGQETLDLSQTSGETYEPNPLPPNVKLIGALKTGTTTVVGSSVNPSVLNQSVTFTATVTANSGVALPTGTVEFEDGGKILDTETLNGTSDQVSFTTSALSVGTHQIQAVYVPTGSFASSPSNTVAQQVNPYGTASTLVFMPQPGETTAGNAINGSGGVVVLIEDSYGNVVANDNSQVTIGIGSFTAAPGNAPPGFINSTTSANASSGEAIFNNLVLDQAGSYTLAANDASDKLSGFGSQGFNVTPAVVHQLFFPATGQPTNTTAGSAINGAGGVQVWIEDAYGNVLTGDNTSVTIKSSLLTAAPGSAAPSSVNSSANATNGEVTFSNLVLTQAGNYKLLTSDSTDSLGSFGSQSFNITPAVVSKLVFPLADQPTNTAAGSAINAGVGGVQVWIEDSYGNVETGDNSNVSIKSSLQTAAPGNAAPSSFNMNVNATGGEATFSNLVLTQAGTYTLSAGDTTDSLANVTSQSFSITPAKASQLYFPSAGQPTNTTAGNAINAGIGGVQVWIEDTYGNVETGDNTSVTVKSSLLTAAPSNASASSFNSSVNATSGEATFSNLVLTQAGNYAILANDPTDSLGPQSSQSFNVTPAAVNKLAFPSAGQPTNTTAGSAINAGTGGVQVWIEDTYGNVVTGDNSQVTIGIGSVAAAPGSATPGFINSTTSINASGGEATFANLVLDQAGSYVLAASNTTEHLSGFNSQGFQVTPAAASQMVFTNLPATATATQVINSPSGFQVSIEDKYGNVATGDTNTVSLGITTGPGTFTAGSTTSTAAAAGVATFKNVTISLSGGYKLSATDSVDKVSGTANLTVNPFDVTSQVTIAKSAFLYSYTTLNYVGTLSITNSSSSTISGGFQVVLKGLPAGVTLAKATLGSTTLSVSSDSSGEPVIAVPTSVLASLAPNQKTTLSLQINNPSKVGITFSTQVLADSS
jgi:competence protein ComGC